MSILASILLGWLFADFLTGIAHWIEDRFITPETPLLGDLVGAPNELHHAQPTVFLESGFVDRQWTTWAIVIPIALGWLYFTGPTVFLASATAGGLLANEIHAWAHRREIPATVRTLQRMGIWQSRSGHLRHHRGQQNSDYCILTDWLNPWLELVGLWRALDRVTMRWQAPDRSAGT